MKRSSGPRKTASKFSCLVRQILNLRALATLTAVVSTITLSQPSEAKVVYTPANVVIRNSTYNLDLNNDGIADFGIPESEVRSTTCPLGAHLTALLNVTPTQGNGVVGSGGLAAALNSGAPIGPRSMYSGTELLMESVKIGWFRHFLGCSYEDIEKGKWLNVTDRYLGLKFQLHGKPHFGWARLSVQFRVVVHRYYFFMATLTGYAYETIPNKPIIAGQTRGPDDAGVEESRNLPAPEPASLGLLALGAQGVTIWRRKETLQATN
jgi:hypothetical protein